MNWGAEGQHRVPPLEPYFPGPSVYGHVVSKYTGHSEIICYITPSNHHRQIFFPSWQVPAVQSHSFGVFGLTGCTLGWPNSIAGESGGTWYHLPIFVQGPLNPSPHRDYLQKPVHCVVFFPPTHSRPQCVEGWTLFNS